MCKRGETESAGAVIEGSIRPYQIGPFIKPVGLAIREPPGAAMRQPGWTVPGFRDTEQGEGKDQDT